MPGETQSSWWLQGVTWLIVIAGWVVVHYVTLARERRKEKRDTAKQIIGNLQDLEKLAHDFHRANEFDEFAAQTVSIRTERLIKTLARNPLSELRLPYELSKELRQSITRRNMDRSTFVPQETSSEIIRDIRNATDDLIDAIEEGKDRVWA